MDQIQIHTKQSIKENDLHFTSDDGVFNISAYLSSGNRELFFAEGSIYLYIQEGTLIIKEDQSYFKLEAGHYLSRKTPVTLTLNDNCYVLIIQTSPNYLCLNTFGGPVENIGRLKYIDGCSDTLLLPPTRKGDPCLNFLHFPKNTIQTMHHHPSFRVGIVTRGNGQGLSELSKNILSVGDIFFIPAFCNHKFDSFGDIMDIIAFHPDSDWGPTDEIHPMINRTWVNGQKL